MKRLISFMLVAVFVLSAVSGAFPLRLTANAASSGDVYCNVKFSKPAICCNAGQTILLNECNVQFVYGSPAVDASQIVWKKDGQVITEFSATSVGKHTLTATFGGMTMFKAQTPPLTPDIQAGAHRLSGIWLTEALLCGPGRLEQRIPFAAKRLSTS